MTIEEALAIAYPAGGHDPLEALRADICGWPPALRRKMIEMLDRFPGLAPEEQARKLRLASRNLAVMLETAYDQRAPGHAGALAAMKRDDIHAVDLRIAIDACDAAAAALEGR
jgi:hypothetical protein